MKANPPSGVMAPNHLGMLGNAELKANTYKEPLNKNIPIKKLKKEIFINFGDIRSPRLKSKNMPSPCTK